MNKRTKFIIGVSLVVSAITTAISFLALCVKKKSAWQAILAITATEGLVGLTLMQEKLPKMEAIIKPRRVKLTSDDFEIFSQEDIGDADTAECACDSEAAESTEAECECTCGEQADEADPA